MENLSNELAEALRREKFAYLTTVGRKTGKPHTVELWFAYADGSIFLSHEGEETDWMKNVTVTRHVRVRIGRLSLEADATVLEAGKAEDAGRQALYEKYYGRAPKATIDDWFELSTVIKLDSIKYSA